MYYICIQLYSLNIGCLFIQHRSISLIPRHSELRVVRTTSEYLNVNLMFVYYTATVHCSLLLFSISTIKQLRITECPFLSHICYILLSCI
jgi:hypothetical protein